MCTRIYGERDDFNFGIVNFPHPDIATALAYGNVYIFFNIYFILTHYARPRSLLL